MFKKWFEVFFRPVSCKSYKREASVGKAVLNVFIAGLIAGIVWFIVLAIAGGIIGSVARFGLFGAGTGILAGVMALVYYVIGSILALLIGSAILLLFAKIFKGKGDYTTQTYYLSLYSAALILISAIGWIPILGQIIMMLANLWSLYPLTITLREAHKYSTVNAVLTWIIPAIILAILWTIMGSVAFFTGLKAIPTT